MSCETNNYACKTDAPDFRDFPLDVEIELDGMLTYHTIMAISQSYGLVNITDTDLEYKTLNNNGSNSMVYLHRKNGMEPGGNMTIDDTTYICTKK